MRAACVHCCSSNNSCYCSDIVGALRRPQDDSCYRCCSSWARAMTTSTWSTAWKSTWIWHVVLRLKISWGLVWNLCCCFHGKISSCHTPPCCTSSLQCGWTKEQLQPYYICSWWFLDCFATFNMNMILQHTEHWRGEVFLFKAKPLNNI